MKRYDELDSLGKKARDAEQRLDCEKCPIYRRCTATTIEACTYVFEQGFRKGYNLHKREVKQKQDKEERQ